MALPSFLDNILNGLNGTGTTPYSSRINNQSSHTTPTPSPAIILPRLLGEVAPTLNIPSAYQPVVRTAASKVLDAVMVNYTPPPAGTTDVGSPQHIGNVATNVFSGINSTLRSTAPMFGIPSNKVDPMVNAVSALANVAAGVGKTLILQKYGTTLLTAQRYVEYGNAVVKAFQGSYDAQPAIAQATAIKSQLPIILPKSGQGLLTASQASQQQLMSSQAGQQLVVSNGIPVSPAFSGVTSNIGPLPDAIEGVSAATGRLVASDVADSDNANKYKVYLVSALNAKDTFLFQTQPTISITEEAKYSSFSPLHAPGDVMSFKNSPSRTLNVTDVKLISRTPYEATENLKLLHLLRSWTKPYFGQPATTESADTEVNASNTSPDPTLANQSPPTPAPSAAAIAVQVKALEQIEASRASVRANTAKLSAAAVAAKNTELEASRQAVIGASGKMGISLNMLHNAPKNATPLTTVTPTAASAQSALTGSVLSSFGSPPEVLYLYGYSDAGKSPTSSPQNLRRIPVVLTSIAFTYPNAVDYIPTTDGIPFPIVMDITLSLSETKSPFELEQFSLNDFRQGKLIGW